MRLTILASAALLGCVTLGACMPQPTPRTVTVTQPGPTVTVTASRLPPTSPGPVTPTSPSSTGPRTVGPSPTEPPVVQGTVELRVGEKKEIPLTHKLNQSTRYGDQVTTKADETVAKAGITAGDAPKGCNPGGCEQPQTLVIEGLAPGETKVVVSFTQFQRAPSDPREWKIVVR